MHYLVVGILRLIFTWLNQSRFSFFFFQITSVQSKSDTVNTSLFDKRENIEKLHRTRNLLRKVQVNALLLPLLFLELTIYAA
jgi:hypothetical protein